MQRLWYVVANAARARLIERTRGQDDWTEVEDLVHPGSRQPGAALARDRPGHVEGTGHGTGSAAYVPRTDPRRHEHERFARELAARLDAAVAAGRCDGLVLVASSPFLGVLAAQLGDGARQRTLGTVAHDWTTLPRDALLAKLRETP